MAHVSPTVDLILLNLGAVVYLGMQSMYGTLSLLTEKHPAWLTMF